MKEQTQHRHVQELHKDSTDGIRSVCSVGLCRKRKRRLQTRAVAYSDIGAVRKSNEDLVFASNECRLYVVLDGIGGSHGGADASLIVLKNLRTHIEGMCEANSAEADHDLELSVRDALRAATLSMLELADRDPEFAKMGTVFALAYVVDGVLLYTHVGDCRVYLIRQGHVRQLTTDETFVQLMVDEGQISSEDVRQHPMKNVVLNSVGTRASGYDPVVHSKMLLPGDTVLLTSDGVSDVLTNDQLAELVVKQTDSNETAKSIVKAAFDAGSRDNASCVVVGIDHTQDGPSTKKKSMDLHVELAKLHDMLADIDELDSDLRSDLVAVAEDIRQAVKTPETSVLAQLRDQLRDRSLQFEVTHPRLTAIVSNIADMLAGVGI